VGLTPELVQAAISEAHSNGIKVIGHLYLTSWSGDRDKRRTKFSGHILQAESTKGTSSTKTDN
jgi:hypothetical protein